MIRGLFNWLERFRNPPYHIDWVEDLPNAPRTNTVYVIGGRKHPFYAAVVCPRKKCKEVIHLEISTQFSKRWELSENKDGTATLFPSVHVTGLKCGCHYWLRQGRIIWSETPTFFVPEENRAKK